MVLEYDLHCNCPDFTKRKAKNLYSPYLSNQIDRSWEYSNAGVDPGQYCKHIWQTLISKNLLDQIEIPNDPRIPESPQVQRQYNTNYGSDARRGDRFY